MLHAAKTTETMRRRRK